MKPQERYGTVLVGRYRLGEVIGRGGMGVALEGEHLLTGRKVAIKLLSRADETGAARMLQEARAAAKLSHPHVVDILDMGDDEDGTPFLVMERLHGESLADLLRREGRLSAAQTLHLLAPVLGALACAHAAGIVHRDVKPSNIFLARDAAGRVVPKLLDFGVAKLHLGADLTDSGTTVGTPEYMSPEQARGQLVGPPTDVWALGAVLYRCLGGSPPFAGANTPDVLIKVVHAAPTPLSELGVDPRLAAVLDRALQKSVDARYASVSQLAHALVGAAVLARLELPADPEPVGLPEWPQWIARTSSANATLPSVAVTGTTKSTSSDTSAPQHGEGTSGSIAAFNGERRVVDRGTSRRLSLALAAGIVLGGGWLLMRASDRSADVTRESPTAAVGAPAPSSTLGSVPLASTETALESPSVDAGAVVPPSVAGPGVAAPALTAPPPAPPGAPATTRAESKRAAPRIPPTRRRVTPEARATETPPPASREVAPNEQPPAFRFKEAWQ